MLIAQQANVFVQHQIAKVLLPELISLLEVNSAFTFSSLSSIEWEPAESSSEKSLESIRISARVLFLVAVNLVLILLCRALRR